VVAALALVFVPPSPPTVSEFQPTVQKEIEEAPSNLSSRFGSGGNGVCVTGQTCDEPLSASVVQKRVIEKARVRRCVGNPPRQTEDPQSPPCVNFWEGDNGGATAKGVTRDEIRVAVPWMSDTAFGAPQLETLASFFNARYEFYGRKLRLFDLGRIANNAAAQRAAAQKAANEFGAFAALYHASDLNLDFRRELVRLGVMSIYGRSWLGSTSAFLKESAPYAWDYYPPVDESEQNLAQFACNTLVGRPAKYAGPTLQESKRQFAAIFIRRDTKDTPPTAPLAEGLEKCGASLYVADSPNEQTSRLALIADLQSRGITTVVLLEWGSGASSTYAKDASAQHFYPEWLIVGADQEDESMFYGFPAEQRAHVFGPPPWNKHQRPSDEPTFWALREIQPQADAFEAMTSRTIDDYHGLMLLAAGIQMAGPKLTPASFAASLERTRFPNPGSGAPPYYQANVGFASSDHSMIDDYTIVWWSDFAPTYRWGYTYGNTETGGGWCWLYNGSRWSLGQWPAGDLPLFDSSKCR
jgi:hypothetical protein